MPAKWDKIRAGKGPADTRRGPKLNRRTGKESGHLLPANGTLNINDAEKQVYNNIYGGYNRNLLASVANEPFAFLRH